MSRLEGPSERSPAGIDRERARLLAALAIALLALSAAAGLWLRSRERPGERPRLEYRVPINRADAATLQLLPGVGPTLAQRIRRFRERHGPIRSADELRKVNGIGRLTAQEAAPHIEFTAPAAGNREGK